MSPCVRTGAGFVCSSTIKKAEKVRKKCPSCGKRRTMVVLYENYWYGVTITCLGCGDEWVDGERSCRPFERGWREGRISGARAAFNRFRLKKDFAAPATTNQEDSA